MPKLAAVLVGDDPASEVYVRNKQRACQQVAIESELHRLAEDVSQDDVLHLLTKLNQDESVHGVLVQLPLPATVDAEVVLRSVWPSKDVDAFHPENVGRIVQGTPRFLPCTPRESRSCCSGTELKPPVVMSLFSAVAILLAGRWPTCFPIEGSVGMHGHSVS